MGDYELDYLRELITSATCIVEIQAHGGVADCGPEIR